MSVGSAPRESAHARLRFVQRAGVSAGSLARAWREGAPVAVEGHDYHRARYDETAGVVMLARGGVVTTVLDAAYAEFAEGER